MLKKLQQLPEDQPLIAHSGVQFLDYGFRIEPDFSFSRWFLEKFEKRADGQDLRVLRPIETNKRGEGYIDSETHEPVTEMAVYSVQFQRALEAFDSVWLPAPFFKHKGFDDENRETFERGPTNWVRMRIAQVSPSDANSGEFTHRLTFAIDTRPMDAPQGRAYISPLPEDVRNETRFLFAPNLRDNAWYLYQPWVTGWLQDELKRSLDLKRYRIPRREDNVPAECAHWALYVVLLQGVQAVLGAENSSAKLPKIRFINTFGATAARTPIDVDLVLDIGNSRTCGVLIETTTADTLDLRNASVLELRDISRPQFVYQEPFRSHVEFAPAEFGNEFRSKQAGGQRGFKWPSLVRVGPEALRLNGQSSGAQGDTGLSGPKRYLWDERENPQPWQFNVSESVHRDQTAVYGDLLLLLTQDGETLDAAGADAQQAIEPKFSRASMFTFMVMELVQHAISQINSPDYRATKQHPHVHRRLRRILFTIPTATPIVELLKYQKRCEAAVKLLWDAYGWGPSMVGSAERPQVIIAYDEATCTQIVYLYNEIVEKSQRTPSDFFSLINPKPLKRGNRLRIASIDIGGGTTDLMIVTYQIDHPSNALNPRQNFREGFRKAGDDILEAVISRHVLKPVQDALTAAGMRQPAHFLRGFMSDAGKGAQQQHLRKLFVSRILVPVALHLLSQYENIGMFGDVHDNLTFGEILGANLGSLQRAVEYFEQSARNGGAADFSLSTVVLPLDFAGLASTINGVMGGILSLMCEVIHRFDCDVLLLSGRPSRLPVMRDMMLRFLPTAPHRVIFMHQYRVGNWYPFAGRTGTVDDPKTTVVVGALLCALAENADLRDFPLRRNGLTIESTARYIGHLLGETSIHEIIFAQEKGRFPTESKKLVIDAPMYLGFKQMPLNRWPGTPLFFLDFADADGAGPAATPWSVTLRRADPQDDQGGTARSNAAASEQLWVEQIVDCNGNELSPRRIELRLQTLLDSNGYWLDTGVVSLM